MFLLLLAAVQVAQPAAPSPVTIRVIDRPAPDPAAVAAAERLLLAMDYEKTQTNILDGMIAGQRGQFAARFGSDSEAALPPELVAQVYAVLERHIRDVFRDQGPMMRKATVLLYAQSFTAPELDRLAAIQRDPVMQKSMRVMPQLLNETMTLARGMFAKLEPDLKRDVEKLVTDYMSAHQE